MSKLTDIKVLLLMVLSLMTACQKEVETPSPASEVQTMHYRAIFRTDVGTRATVGDGMVYEFEAGDRVYVESEDGSLYGFLSMSDAAEVGNHEAYFEGDLSYVGGGSPDSNPLITLVLVSGTDNLHSVTDGKVDAVTGGSYSQDGWAPSLEEAVSRLSHFTGSGNLKDNSFTLHQQSSFLKCSVRMSSLDAPIDREMTVKLVNNSTLIREAGITVSQAGSIPFVFAFLGGNVSLENAQLVVEWKDSENTDQSSNFNVSNQTLAANTYYTISRSTLSYDGFKITAISNETTIKFNYDGIQYSLDFGDTWTPYTSQFSLNADDVACIKGNRTQYFNPATDQWGTPSNKPIFEANNKCYISGNIMSLLADEENLSESAFQGAFSKGKTAIEYIDIHPDDPLILPVTTLASQCYMQMFRNCTSLKRTPQFTVEGTAYRCCYNMFRDCKNLEDVSGIELPAMTLSQDCYRELFRSCEKITTSPDLPALDLEPGCYQQMFSDCKKLGYIKCLTKTNVNVKNSNNEYLYTNNWVTNAGSSVSSKSFFKNPDNNSWMQNNNSGIPSGWTIVDYTE